jgi:hypothetical protein
MYLAMFPLAMSTTSGRNRGEIRRARRATRCFAERAPVINALSLIHCNVGAWFDTIKVPLTFLTRVVPRECWFFLFCTAGCLDHGDRIWIFIYPS